MSVEAYDVCINGDAHGAILICNTTGLPLPLSHHRFSDRDEGEAFLQWLPQDARLLSQVELKDMADQWLAEGKPGVGNTEETV